MEKLREKYPNNNSYSTHLVKLINEHKVKNDMDTVLLIRKELLKIKKIEDEKLEHQVPRQKDIENYISLKDLRILWRQLDDNVDKLIIGFYIWYPALRSDWCDVKIENEHFVFDKFVKRKGQEKYQGSLRKEIHIELLNLIEFVPKIPKKNNTFCKKLANLTQKYFGKRIGVGLFRKIWVHDNAKNVSIHERKILAKEMNHSLNVSRLHYEKINLSSI